MSDFLLQSSPVGHVQLKDLAGPVTYHRDGNELVLPGLYLDLQALGLPRLRRGSDAKRGKCL